MTAENQAIRAFADGIASELNVTTDSVEQAIRTLIARGISDTTTIPITAERLAMINVIINGGSAMEKWQRHTDVTTYVHLREWTEMKLREVLMMRSRREHDDGLPVQDEMDNYLVGKQGVLTELLANMRQIEERTNTSQNAMLMVIKEIDRLLLVIESAVRWSDPLNHPAVLSVLKQVQSIARPDRAQKT